MSSAPPVVRGRQEPRVLTVPPSAVESLALDAYALWDLTGRRLDHWQTIACDAIFAVDEVGDWAATEFGLLVSRQVGKGEILQVWDLAHFFLWPKPNREPKVVVQTFHEFGTADIHYRKLKRRIMSTPWMRRRLKGRGREDARGISGISTGMGKRIFETEGGDLLVLATRTGSAGIGFTVDALGVDEAQESPDETMEALLFTQDALDTKQVLYTGTAPTVTQDGAHFEALRDRGRAGTFPRTGWAEWSPDGSDDPDLADAIKLDDRTVWAQGVPSLGIRTSEATVEDKYNSLIKTNPDAFKKQRLSIWPNPRPIVEQAKSDLDMKIWNASADGSRLQGGGVVLAVSLGRGAGYSSICGAQDAGDGRFRVEHLATAERTLWVASRLKELSERYRSSLIVLDERNCAPILTDLDRAGVRYLKMSTNEVGAAFEVTVEAVNTRRVVHAGQDELTLSFQHAQPRAMTRTGLSTWEQSNPLEPVTQAQAATLAIWGVKRLAARLAGSRPAPGLPSTLDSGVVVSGHHLPYRDSGLFSRDF